MGRAASFLKVPIKNVPLTAGYSHDVKAMSAADANAGVLYVVNPNNPTGTMTPTADIEWLVDNKPAGSIVVIDEAYIHFSNAYPNNTTSHLAAAGKDVLVNRTFSKIFGMAGARVGYVMGRPDLLQKLWLYDGGYPVQHAAGRVGGLRHSQPRRQGDDDGPPQDAEREPRHDGRFPHQAQFQGDRPQ